MKKIIFQASALAFAATLLTACGGSDTPVANLANNSGTATGASSGASGSGTTPAANGNATAGNSFVAGVLALINGASDSATPVAIDAYDAAPDDKAQPQPLG
ncbi:hypothetical protein [Noviherbaspirillum galbum]|uniref:Lipoprotein n=1 Tax=Noviherbaspirillum galbum TaxID=2709383 RepID=A0A6B3SW35_9BURK|nr:hypothetical protein [Noviherbaspirillum galbum]NEX64768.1 hypothetical protein [Noviherbaspirillum galbum]